MYPLAPLKNGGGGGETFYMLRNHLENCKNFIFHMYVPLKNNNGQIVSFPHRI